MSDPSDAALLHGWAAGDAGAGATLFRRYYDGLFRFLRNKVDGEIEDLIQTTMLACLESVHRFEQASSFKTFLYGIARHKLYHHYRRLARGDAADPGATPVEAMSESPSRVLARREEERVLLVALRSIPLTYQITLELHYWEAMSVAEIGEVLQEPPGTIKSRLHRGRRLLRDEIERLASTSEVAASTLGNLSRWAAGVRDAVGSSGRS
jgi:RNA polymerase sigma-70 factor (ECF subfamily)